MTHADAEKYNPTPQRVTARFAALPAYLPRNVHRFDDSEALTLENLISGHVIAIDGRWWDVLGCTSANRWVSVDTTGPKMTAHETTPVYLARREPVSEPVATGV
jgi:transposase InsO family protein